MRLGDALDQTGIGGVERDVVAQELAEPVDVEQALEGEAELGGGLAVEVRGAGGTQQCRTAGSTKGKVAVRCSRPTRGRPTAELVRAQSSGAVLAVPSTAVVVRGAQTVVRVATGDTVREVPVTVGVAGGGYAAVSSTALSAGDEVVVGERREAGAKKVLPWSENGKSLILRVST